MSLKKLLDIREKRKEKVFLELSIANDTVVAREENLQKAKETLVFYREWRVKKQKSLFDDLTSQQFKPKEYEKYLAKLTKIDVQENYYSEQLKAAEPLLQAAKNEYQQIKTKSLSVVRELEKLTEILKGTEENEKVLLLKKEESEAEEFMPINKF